MWGFRGVVQIEGRRKRDPAGSEGQARQLARSPPPTLAGLSMEGIPISWGSWAIHVFRTEVHFRATFLMLSLPCQLPFPYF